MAHGARSVRALAPQRTTMLDEDDAFDGMDGESAAASAGPVNHTDIAMAVANPLDDMHTWKEMTDKKGRTYYYNTTTGESTWKKPVALADPHGHAAAKQHAGGHMFHMHGHAAAKGELAAQSTRMGAEGGGGAHAGAMLAAARKEKSAIQEHVDPKGRTYYLNTQTGETSWEKPKASALRAVGAVNAFGMGGLSAAAKRENGGGGGGGGGGSLGQVAAKEEWKSMTDKKGRTYYYNTATGQSSWKKPAALDEKQPSIQHNEAAEAVAAAVTGPHPDWSQVPDSKGRLYWYNTATGESTWKTPAGVLASGGGGGGGVPGAGTSGASKVKAAADYAESSGGGAKPREDGTAAKTKQVPAEEEEEDAVIAAPGAEEWTPMTDSKGRTYYYNTATGQSSWKKPDTVNAEMKTVL